MIVVPEKVRHKGSSPVMTTWKHRRKDKAWVYLVLSVMNVFDLRLALTPEHHHSPQISTQ